MSTDENDKNCNSKEWNKLSQNKFELTADMKEKLQHLPEVINLIENLQKQLEKQRRKLRKLRHKFKRKDNLQSIACQTENSPKKLTEEITEAAEKAILNSGFVFEETSGLYYDYNTGYYYNAEYGLYYDGHTGTYMTYNTDTKTYEFHSKISIDTDKSEQTDYPEKQQALKRKLHHLEDSGGLEEGECSDNSGDEDVVCQEQEQAIQSLDINDVSELWPPCMRIIVEESTVSDIKIGSLHILTYEGGTLGREGEHSILIPDINVSKHHLKFTFDKNTNKYLATDLGSRNGTLLNNKRMSASKQESDALEVEHGSYIQIGTTVLLCHIHPGTQTCDNCEPGLLQSHEDKTQFAVKNKSEQHKNELRKLKKKFGIEQYNSNNVKVAVGYVDRAQARRETIGSQNPHEKTQVASVNESISSENVGFKLLAKMGWTEGQSLGKGQGLLEPINVVANEGTAGIGSTNTSGNTETKRNEKKQNVWEKTQQRYQNLEEIAPDSLEIFE